MARTKSVDLTLSATVSALGVQFQVKVVDTVDDEGSLGETAGERHGIPAHDAPCGVKDAQRRAVCRPAVNAWQ